MLFLLNMVINYENNKILSRILYTIHQTIFDNQFPSLLYIEESNNNGSTENKASKPANEPVVNSCLIGKLSSCTVPQLMDIRPPICPWNKKEKYECYAILLWLVTFRHQLV